MFEYPDVPEDTSLETRHKVIELLRAMPPEKKLNRVFDLSGFAKSLIIAEMLQNNSFKSENDFKGELAKRIYGFEIGSKIAKMYESRL